MELVYWVGGLSGWKSNAPDPFSQLFAVVSLGAASTQHHVLHQYNQHTWVPKRSSAMDSLGALIPLFTGWTAEELANDLTAKLQQKLEQIRHESEPIKIVIVAHSSGSAITRGALLAALENKHDWPEHVTNMIHIGGITRGWQFNSEMPKLQLWLGPAARALFPFWFPWHIYRGSKFITETRIGLNRQLAAKKINRIYLLGTKDEYLSPGDIIEVGRVSDETGPIYLEIKDSTHITILKKPQVREFLIRGLNDANGFESAYSELSDFREIPSEDIDDYLDPMDNEPARTRPEVRDVVIVLHGIRDNGFWAKRIANRIKSQARTVNKESKQGHQAQTSTVKVVSLSYGYFSLWDFLRPGGRRQAVEWFQDVYGDICALYPKAQVSFIGHSNGTYLGCHALACQNLTYRTMILAGSVVRQDFWSRTAVAYNCRSRIGRLMNFQAIGDYIVALLPGGLEWFPVLGPWMNVGGSGAYGFNGLDCDEQRQILGGHGAAIGLAGWDELADLVLNEQAQIPDLPPFKRVPIDRANRMFRMLRPLGGLSILWALVLVVSPMLTVLWKLFWPDSPIPEWFLLQSLRIPIWLVAIGLALCGSAILWRGDRAPVIGRTIAILLPIATLALLIAGNPLFDCFYGWLSANSLHTLLVALIFSLIGFSLLKNI